MKITPITLINRIQSKEQKGGGGARGKGTNLEEEEDHWPRRIHWTNC